jgi:hypothetical protein
MYARASSLQFPRPDRPICAAAPSLVRTPGDEQDYHVPFRFTGKLNKLTVKLGPEELTPAEREMILGMQEVTK